MSSNICKQSFKEIIHRRHDLMLLQDFLKFSMPTISIEAIKELILNNQCEVDDNIAQMNDVIKENQTVSWFVDDYFEGFVNTKWKLLWQSDEILAVHKPANLPVHKTTRNVINTLVKLVQRESEFNDAHLLHRLDLDTSGIVLLGKTNENAQYWQPKLTSLMQKKIYRAIVYGKPQWETLKFECRLNTLKESEIRCKMHVLKEGKLSETHFKVIKSNGLFSIIECELKTGRKHQIRAHLSHLGHPIVGDKIYSNDGEYYLKRLEDNTNETDELKLMTSHHLLMAYQLDVMNSDKQLVSIVDDNYSEQWLSFCQQQKL